MDEDVRRAIAALDEGADPMHLDHTPAVAELSAMGLRAIGPLTEPLASESQETRLHAQRAWEGVVYGRHGFVGGQGFPSAEAEAAAVAELREVAYSFEDGPEERAAAIERLRAWLASARP
ncbi:MAG: hypothetical protein M3N56_11460 [Actinomycetota bacterium]|nr:hypothetical protein [Actinomycetota bacterium]